MTTPSIPIAEPQLGEREFDRVEDTLTSGQLADGPVVREFESAFASFCGSDHAVATSNGTTALESALRAIGVGRNDHVVTTPFSFVATANAIRHCGATPVFADIDPETYALDPEAVESAIHRQNGDVAAILVVHLYGLPADMDRLVEISATYDVPIVEDAAQAHGAAFDGERVGSLGDAACFSFYPTKNMTTGEGGMVATNREDVASRVRQYVDHGRAEGCSGYEHVDVGHNYRMSSVEAAIGLVQLEKLPAFNRARRNNAARLSSTLSEVPGVTTPVEPDDRRHVYHQYTVRCADRRAVRAALDAQDVGSSVYYPTPIHEQPAYAGIEGSFPIAERASRDVLSLPVHPGLTPPEVDRVASAVRGAVRRQVADD